MIIIKLFQGVARTLRKGEGGGEEGFGTGEKRRHGAVVSLRFESSLQFMTRVGLRGTSRVKGG